MDEDILALVSDEVHQPEKLWDVLDLQVKPFPSVACYMFERQAGRSSCLITRDYGPPSGCCLLLGSPAKKYAPFTRQWCRVIPQQQQKHIIMMQESHWKAMEGTVRLPAPSYLPGRQRQSSGI